MSLVSFVDAPSAAGTVVALLGVLARAGPLPGEWLLSLRLVGLVVCLAFARQGFGTHWETSLDSCCSISGAWIELDHADIKNK